MAIWLCTRCQFFLQVQQGRPKKSSAMYKLIVLAALVSVAFAGGKGKCPWAMGKYPFDETKFVGEWRVLASTPLISPTAGAVRCARFDYQIGKENHIIGISGLDKDGKTLKTEVIGHGMFGKPEKNANLMSVWKKLDGSYTTVMMQSIVATDYENYAVLFACKPTFDEKTQTFGRYIKAGILVRPGKTLSADTLQVLRNILSGYDIEDACLLNHDLTGCEYKK